LQACEVEIARGAEAVRLQMCRAIPMIRASNGGNTFRARDGQNFGPSRVVQKFSACEIGCYVTKAEASKLDDDVKAERIKLITI